MQQLPALRTLGVAGFASMVSMRLCDAMLPALAQEFRVDLGQTTRVISAFALAYGLLQLAYGTLGERFGKQRVVCAATTGCCMSAAAAAFSPTLDALMLSRVAMGAAAAGIIPLTMAWVGDEVAYVNRQVVLARLLGWTVLGMVAGSWAGGAISQLLGWRAAFLVVGALFFVVTVLLFRRLRGLPRSPGRTSTRQFARVVRSSWARGVLAVSFFEGALVFGAVVFVPSLLHERFGMPLGEAGAVVALFGVGGLAYTRLAPHLLRRLDAPALVKQGAACLAAAFLMLGATPHWVFAIPACLLAGFGFYMLHNTLQTCATQLSPGARGTGVSMFVCALFLGQSSGVAFAGWINARFAPNAWFFIAALGVLTLAWHFAPRLRVQLSSSEAAA